MEPFVSLKNVQKIYRMGEVEIRAVDGMDFDIWKGEFVVIVGPSGAGKTTVLNILGGMDTCTSGSVRVDGREISGLKERQLTAYRRDDIGFVFQFYNLIQNLTALENVELALQICREPLDAAQVLEDVGLAGRKDNFPAQLSGGEQQMLAVGRALMSQPDLVMLDEPSLGLAPLLVRDIFQIINRINAEGRTVLLVEQNAYAALSIADYAYILEVGSVVLEGPGKEMLANPKVKEAYLGG